MNNVETAEKAVKRVTGDKIQCLVSEQDRSLLVVCRNKQGTRMRKETRCAIVNSLQVAFLATRSFAWTRVFESTQSTFSVRVRVGYPDNSLSNFYHSLVDAEQDYDSSGIVPEQEWLSGYLRKYQLDELVGRVVASEDEREVVKLALRFLVEYGNPYELRSWLCLLREHGGRR